MAGEVTVLTSNGAVVPLSQLAASQTWDGSGNMTAQTWTDGTWSWQQTYTYNGSGQQTAASAITRIV